MTEISAFIGIISTSKMYFLNPRLFWTLAFRSFLKMLVSVPMSLYIFSLYNAVDFADREIISFIHLRNILAFLSSAKKHVKKRIE